MKSSSEVCIAIYISCRRKEDFGVKSTLEYSHLAQQLVFPFGHHHFSPKQVPLEFVRRSNSAVAQVRPKTRDDCCFMRRMRWSLSCPNNHPDLVFPVLKWSTSKVTRRAPCMILKMEWNFGLRRRDFYFEFSNNIWGVILMFQYKLLKVIFFVLRLKDSKENDKRPSWVEWISVSSRWQQRSVKQTKETRA